MIKDLFGIRVILSVNVINHVILVSETTKIVSAKKKKKKKKQVDKLVEECTENIEETRLVEITSVELHSAKNENKHKCSSCMLCIVFFQHFLQLTLELVLILFIFTVT